METLIDVSSSGREEDPFPTQRIGLDRGVCDATSGDARPSIAAYSWARPPNGIRAAVTSI